LKAKEASIHEGGSGSSDGVQTVAMSHANSVRSFFTDTFVFTGSSLISLVVSGGVAFLIPKYLPIEDYGYYKLFYLYVTYVSLLYLSFTDGVYLRLSGKDITEAGAEIERATRFLLLQLMVVVVPSALLIILFIHEPAHRVVAIMLLPFLVVFGIQELFYRTTIATRRFRLAGIVNIGMCFASAGAVLLLVSLGYLRFYYFIAMGLAMEFLNLVVLGLYLRKYVILKRSSLAVVLNYGKENISSGIFVMLGGMAFVIILSLDRLMTSSFFTVEKFAMYAFAGSLLTTIYTLVNSMSSVVFPHLSAASDDVRQKAYSQGKPLLIMLWGLMLSLFFPMSLVIRLYLPNYSESMPILRVLFCSVGFGVVIQIIHQNYYWVYRKQRRYLLWGFVTVCLLVGLNILAIKLVGTLLSVAVATLISFLVWYLLNEIELRNMGGESRFRMMRNLVGILTYLGVFLSSSLLIGGTIAPMLVYLASFALLTCLIFGPELRRLIAMRERMRV
jgi:O-antigen/teichoic acid export membrane protein